VDAASTVLRGRLRESAQLTRRLAQPWPLEIRYDEFTADIAENRILASAVERLLRVPGVRPQSRRILRHLAGRFPGVALLRPGAPLPSWQPTRLNAALQPALHLAELALTRASVDVSAGAVTSSGLLLDLATLFQDFLAAALRVALAGRHGGRLVAEPADHHLDVGGRFAIRPDLVWRRGGTVAAVIDANTSGTCRWRTPTRCWPTAPRSACRAATSST
jgi:5-methylcytosine-specific restriction enzyme subunit McrC